jgi:hypothetical protein
VKVKSILSLLALLAALSPLALSQSRDTGAIVGSVLDEQKTPLPGATVTLTSPALMGPRTNVTEADGSFRFPALPPGVYALKATLQGFKDVVQENIRVTTTVRLTFDLTMQQAAMAEEITVIAKSPTVDVKSTETASVTLTNEILRNIPYVSNFSTDIVNLAPGVISNSAYGASQNTGIAYSMDGVNVADPEGGSAWVFVDMNIIEESKIMGVGLPAEYGNFTGVIFNIVTKSGGNDFSGHFEFIYQGEKNDKPDGFWQQDNIKDYLTDFPNMVAPKFKLVDGNAHLGGPIMKDKLWFYVGTQYQWFGDWATGFPDPRAYKQPRLFVKLTSQLSPTLNMIGSLEIDTYDGKNRYAAANHAVDATIIQKSPEIVGNFSLTKILSPKTFFDVKAAYFWGYYYLDPKAGNVSAHWSLDENFLYYSAGYFYYADRTRLQVNASVTHYAEDFIKGNHDFKFGVEVERSYSRNRYGYPGPNHMTYYDYYGENYLAYQYEGYDTHTYYTRFEGFAQDSWQITDRININLGARFSQNWGTVKGVSGSVYSAMRLAPRIGLTYDVFGDKTTVLKAHYGQFTEAMLTGYHASMNPASAFKDRVYYYWDGSAWVEYDRLTHEELYHMADDIKHPYLNQFTVSLERELFRDASFSVSYIRRNWKNIISYYDTKSDYRQVPITVAYDINKTFNIYERISPWYAHYYVIDNIDTSQPWVLGDPYRSYWGLEFLFNKRFSNRWQLLASFVYSKAWGTQDNGFGDDFGWNSRDGLWPGDPNFWTNADGNSTVDPTYMLKLQGTYMLPFDIAFNAYFRAVTGNAWTTRYRTKMLNQGRVTFYAEPRGSNHYPLHHQLDLRLEKIFTLAQKYRLGLIFDAFNVYNSNTITNWGTRIGYDWVPGTWPSTEGHNLLGIARPRQLRLGIRMIF